MKTLVLAAAAIGLAGCAVTTPDMTTEQMLCAQLADVQMKIVTYGPILQAAGVDLDELMAEGTRIRAMLDAANVVCVDAAGEPLIAE